MTTPSHDTRSPSEPAPPSSPGTDPRFDDVRNLASLLDSRFRIPGTRQTFGLDAVLGVIPGVGDVAGLVASGLVIMQAARLGARGWTLVNMLLGAGLYATVGVVPIVGTVFDVVYKANARNVALLEQHVQDTEGARRAARRSVVRSLLLVVMAVAALSVVVVAGTVWLWRALF